MKKWEQIDYEKHDSLPFIKEALAQIKLKVIDKIIYPHNTIFISEAIACYQIRKGRPLTYKYYRENLKPLCQKALGMKANCSLKTNPKEKSEKIANHSKKWVCSICQYVYDDKIPFEDLDASWRCPFCGVSKEMFELI